jgi:salicylate 5-hydroxylase small subunit
MLDTTMLDMGSGYMALQNLYSEYSACLDEGEFEKWPEFFLDECEYRIQPRENHERKFPLSILWFESKGMMKDRIYGIRETLYHDPYYQRHIVSAPHVTGVEGDEIRSEANYLVLRTKRDELSEVFNVGRYIDVIRGTGDGLKFKSRLCIFDSELIRNSIIYPI